MVAISASSNSNASALALQAAIGRTRLQQAEREARDAQSTANELRVQAQEADREAQKSQNNVSTIASENRRTQATYTQQIQNNPTQTTRATVEARTALNDQDLIASNLRQKSVSNPPANGAATVNARYAASNASNPQANVNTLGQTTGRLVSVTA
jgi:hypothetical protein